MHPELYLTLHQQQQREVDQALAVALLVRERTTSAPSGRRPRTRVLLVALADARRALGRPVRRATAVPVSVGPAACCPA
ncbi:hypothetical protein [Cellulomonas septica]|uniref:DUF222 domain-containing protein n=1 Tax=Cellulomonas septica TaxID=285080 RepID=A0ABX1JZB4_9CELL|nr:hypothetical protein [Cellulomonas septica]NKY39670.1 hypothetical protein [Cellulomonas septica]